MSADRPHPALVPFSDLARWPAAVAKRLREMGVRYVADRRGHPITTAAELDRALRAQQADDQRVDFL